MKYSFKSHELEPEDKLWLQEAYNNFRKFDIKTAKAKLWSQLPKSFDHLKIDDRFLKNGRDLTLLGVWMVDPQSVVLTQFEKVVKSIKKNDFKETRYRENNC